MADIICVECKATVSDEPGYCSECGYPFDSAPPEQHDGAAAEPAVAAPADAAGGDPVDTSADEAPAPVPVEAAAEETASAPPAQAAAEAPPADPAPAPQPNIVVMPQLDTILRSLSAVAIEVKDLQSRVDEIKQDLDSRPAPQEDKTEKILADVVARLDAITAVQNAIKSSVEQETPQKKKMRLLAAFYKTLNSPNSMFEYMFYICIVQVIFVIVNLFLAAYIVTLVR